MRFIIVLAIILAIPFTTLAGIRGSSLVEATVAATPQAECFIGSIETSYIVSEKRVAFDAVIYIRDSINKPVPGTVVQGAWRDKRGVITSGKCTTGDDGRCAIPHVVRAKFGELITIMPVRGIRIIDVDCPKLKYIFLDNTTFAWATIK